MTNFNGIEYQQIVTSPERKRYAHIDLGRFHWIRRRAVNGKKARAVVFRHFSEEMQRHFPVTVHWTLALDYWLRTQEQVEGVVFDERGSLTSFAQWRVHYARPRAHSDRVMIAGEDRWVIGDGYLEAMIGTGYRQHGDPALAAR
jgi:hypothetical protein